MVHVDGLQHPKLHLVRKLVVVRYIAHFRGYFEPPYAADAAAAAAAAADADAAAADADADADAGADAADADADADAADADNPDAVADAAGYLHSLRNSDL